MDIKIIFGADEDPNTDPKQYIRELFANKDLVHFVGMFDPPRLGVRLFATMLEYGYFPPDTPANHDFRYMLIEWQEISWCVVSIPKIDRDRAEEVAEKTGLRIADGVPTRIFRDKKEMFPFHGTNVFNLENSPVHRVYYNSPAEFDAMVAQEDLEIEHIIKEFAKKHRNPSFMGILMRI